MTQRTPKCHPDDDTPEHWKLCQETVEASMGIIERNPDITVIELYFWLKRVRDEYEGKIQGAKNESTV